MSLPLNFSYAIHLHLCLEDAALTRYSLIPTQKTLMEDFYEGNKQKEARQSEWMRNKVK